MVTRRGFIGAATAPAVLGAAARRPNVVLIITDDQGYGDLSLHGNPHLRTPNLDSIGREGVQFTRFHVSPVCSPTRSSLMTGRYNYRTGIVDTYLGRSMMHPEEVTLPEVLRGAGYRTGIFGKWHLGDNYPMRAMDQGFEEALTLRGGGLAQPSSPPGTGYFDPPLEQNGKPITGKGYCTDIFFDAAREFISRNAKSPFFAYVAPNAPHTPLELREEWAEPYRKMGLDETTAKIYGMVANIDENAGKLIAHLRQLGIERDTLFIFLTDNGPQQRRYNAGMRGLKGTTYEGGIRVPCFMRWPARLSQGTSDSRLAAHIDLMPTILEACGARPPKDRKIDGASLLGSPSLRTIFSQWHRGDEPEPMRNCAVIADRWKLVGSEKRAVELFDLGSDPGEQHDLAQAQPEVVGELRKAYDAWFEDVSKERGYAPPRIVIGTPHENPVLLTRQDWRGPRASWDAGGLGHYEVSVKAPGVFRVALRFPALKEQATAEFEFRGLKATLHLDAGAAEAVFEKVNLPAGEGRMEGRLVVGGKAAGAHYIELSR